MKQRSAIVMATTPGKPGSTFMDLLAITDERGHPRMYVVRSGQPCDPCLQSKEPWLCTHTLDEKPAWKDTSKEKRLQYLYQGDSAGFAREQLGVAISDSIRPFLPKYIGEFKNRPLFIEETPPECVFLAADSASGGKCEFAVIGAHTHGDCLVIVYIDAFLVPGGSTALRRKRIQYAADAIQGCPGFNCPPIIHLPENAPGNVGPELHEYLLDRPSILTVTEWNSRGDTYGVPATDRNAQTTEMELLLSQGRIFFSQNCMTYPEHDGGTPLDELKQKLARQLICWEKVVHQDTTNPLARVTFKWTAKHTAGNDDLAVAALMVAYWRKVITSAQRADRYGEWLRENVSRRRIDYMRAAGIRNNAMAIYDIPANGIGLKGIPTAGISSTSSAASVFQPAKKRAVARGGE